MPTDPIPPLAPSAQLARELVAKCGLSEVMAAGRVAALSPESIERALSVAAAGGQFARQSLLDAIESGAIVPNRSDPAETAGIDNTETPPRPAKPRPAK